MTVKELKMLLKQYEDGDHVTVSLFKADKTAEIFDIHYGYSNGMCLEFAIHEEGYSDR